MLYQCQVKGGLKQEGSYLRFHLTGMAVALAVILYVMWQVSLHGAAQFRVGEGRLVITVTEGKDRVIAYHYQVRRGQSVRVVKTHFWDRGGFWPPEFRLVKGADPNVVGVIEDGQPQTLLILYDVSRGLSWPADDSTETGMELLGRFSGSRSGYSLERIADSNERN
jgi:hypothetical protein